MGRPLLPERGVALLWPGSHLQGGTKVDDPCRARLAHVTNYTSRIAYPAEQMYPGSTKAKRYTELDGGFCHDHAWNAGHKRLPNWVRAG